MVVQAISWAGVLVAAPWLFSRTGAPWLPWGGGVAISYLWLWRALRVSGHPADWVTAARGMGLVAAVVTAGETGQVSWVLWGICVACVAADLLDGWLARRFGGSPAGAVLDMETDQFATLSLALLAMACFGVGSWVLLLPGYRYGFVLLSAGLGWPSHDPKPCDGDNRRARLICASMMVLSLVGVMPGISWAARAAAMGTAASLVAYSYARDVVFLIRERRLA